MNPVAQVALWMVPLEILASGVACELARRWKVVHYVLMFILPACFTPYWLSSIIAKGDWFIISKIYSVVCLAGVSLYVSRWVLNEDLRKKWTKERFQWWKRLELAVIYISLVINITEAVLQDASQERYLNVLSGLLLILGQTTGEDIKPVCVPPTYDALWFLSGMNDPQNSNGNFFYPVAYVLWNHTFCYGSYQHFGVLHLAGPLLLSWWNGWTLFMMYRAYALAFAFQIMFCHKNGASWFFWDKKTFYGLYFNPTYYWCMQWLTLSSVLALLFHQFLLYRQDTRKERVTSLFQFLLHKIGVPRAHLKNQ